MVNLRGEYLGQLRQEAEDIQGALDGKAPVRFS